MPCPSSTLPVNTVTVPLALTRNQADNWRLVLRLPGRRGAASTPCESVACGENTIATTRPDPDFRKSRREMLRCDPVMMPPPAMRASRHARCGYVNRTDIDGL